MTALETDMLAEIADLRSELAEAQAEVARLRDLVEAVQRRPGITLREALADSRHHYSSSAVARASLARQIRSGLIEGLRLEQQGRDVRVWPRERAA